MLRKFALSLLVGLPFAASCDDARLPAEPGAPKPQAALSDGAHEGLAGFYFLPPIAPKTDLAGEFDATLLAELSVEICALAGNACVASVATFTKISGLRLNGGHYHVNWDTRGTADATYRVAVKLGADELGHADVGPAGRRTLPIKFWISEDLEIPPPPPPPPVANDCVLPVAPSLAPDPNRIVFLSGRDGNGEIYVMNADGSVQTRLTNHAASDAAPVWSPDRRMIAFRSDRGGTPGHWQIYAMNADGTNVRQVTFGAGYYNADPAWSPDGRISYVTNRNGNQDIYVCNADGTETNLSNSPATDNWHAWSPDGAHVVFTSARDGTAELYRVNEDGAGVVRLTNTPFEDLAPSFSPDGSRIVFQDYVPGRIHVMNADGSALMVITSAGGEGAPAWSPDGTRIAFQSNSSGGDQIWVMNADGSGRVKLTALGGVSPAWARR